MKRQLGVVVGLLLLLTSASLAASEEPSSNKTISVCRIEYTSLGKTARWHFNFIYSVVTDADGTVSRVAKLGTDKRPAVLNEGALIDCMKTWRLLPQGQHVVLFSLGTTGDGNFISVTDSKRNTIKLLL